MTGGFVQWVNVFFSYSNHQRLLCHSSHFAVVISPSNITLTIQKLQSHFHNPTRVTLKNVTPIFCFFNKRQGKSGHLNSCESAGNFWAVPEHKQICGQAFSSRFQRPEASPSLIRSSLVFPPQLRSKESSLPSPAFDNYFFNKMYFPVFRVSLLFYSAMPTHSETHRPLKMCPLCDFWLHVGWGHFPMSNSTTLIILKKERKKTLCNYSHNLTHWCSLALLSMSVVEWISQGHFLISAPIMVQTPPSSSFPRPKTAKTVSVIRCSASNQQ